MKKTKAFLTALLVLGAVFIFGCKNEDGTPDITDIKVEPGNVKVETRFNFTEDAKIVITVAQGEEVYYVLDKPGVDGNGTLVVEPSRQNKYDGPITSQEIFNAVDGDGKFVLKVRYLKAGGAHELIKYNYAAYLSATPSLRLFGFDEDLVNEEEITLDDLKKAKNIFVCMSNYPPAAKPVVKYEAGIVGTASALPPGIGDINTSDINGPGKSLAKGDVFYAKLVTTIGVASGKISSDVRSYTLPVKK